MWSLGWLLVGCDAASDGTSSSASSTTTCGWIAALCAVLAWGSFGVPIRHISQSSTSLDVSPLVLQSYKTFVCFVTSFFFVAILGEPFVWSWYGLLSGLFWVPGATAGIYGIRNAGLAVAVGTWSSIIVLTSSFCGVVVFKEPVHDVVGAAGAFLTLIVGLVGMAAYSSPVSSVADLLPSSASAAAAPAGEIQHRRPRKSTVPEAARAALRRSLEMERLGGGHAERFEASAVSDADPSEYSEHDDGDDDDGEMTIMLGAPLNKDKKKAVPNFGRWGPHALTARQWGILGAVVNGGWGGMNLIPLHYAKKHQGLSGASYVVSFAGGAVMVNAAMFLILYLYYVAVDRETWTTAISRLPHWHVREMGGRGLLSGILYSIGNFASIVAVTYLGQGTGYSACQMQLLVSGLWGVFYFREIKSVVTTMKWFLSAATALLGILWLAYERESPGPQSPEASTNDAGGVLRW